MNFLKYKDQFVRLCVKYESMNFCIWGHIKDETPDYVFVDTSNGVPVMLDKKKIMIMISKDFSTNNPLFNKG